MNVIDDQKLQTALSGVTDRVLKGLTEQILPVITTLVDSSIEKLSRELETVVGDALADLTAEREETIGDFHGLLTRLDGMTLQLHIPAQKIERTIS